MTPLTPLTPEQEQYMQLQMSRAYYKGMRDGVSLYAHWSNGTQYVGTTGCTLKQAVTRINQEEADIRAIYDKMAQL